jgi:hypothetical protein
VNVIHARPSPYLEPSLSCRLSLLTIIICTVIIKHRGRLFHAPNKTVDSYPIRSHAGGGQQTGKFCAKRMTGWEALVDQLINLCYYCLSLPQLFQLQGFNMWSYGRLLSVCIDYWCYLHRVFRAADWTLTHASYKDTEQSTIEASITLDGVTLTNSLIGWSPNELPSVCREIPVSADKNTLYYTVLWSVFESINDPRLQDV